VIDVVFNFPEVGIAAKNVEEVSRNIVHPLMFRETPMSPLMHYIEAYDGKVDTKDQTKRYSDPCRWRKKDKCNV